MEKSDPPTTPNYHIVFYSSNRTFCQPNTVRASFRSSLDKERMLDCGTQTHDFLGVARDACTAGMVMQKYGGHCALGGFGMPYVTYVPVRSGHKVWPQPTHQGLDMLQILWLLCVVWTF
jgi:hypothetical protein